MWWTTIVFIKIKWNLSKSYKPSIKIVTTIIIIIKQRRRQQYLNNNQTQTGMTHAHAHAHLFWQAVSAEKVLALKGILW